MRTCKECEFEGKCGYYPKTKMFRSKCYLDEIAAKTHRTTKTVIEFHNRFMEITGNDIASFANYIEQEQLEMWELATESEKKRYVQSYYDLSKSEISMLVASINEYLNTWHNVEYVKCKCCGMPIKNNSRYNRTYCDRHKGYHEKDNRDKICIDCGCVFDAEFNRSIRCYSCQEKATREKARIRKQKQRAKMRCHGLDLKE